MSDAALLWEDTIQPGATWSHVVKRGTSLRLIDVDGGANLAAVFYNFECPAERYNNPDTLKAQHIARLTAGFVLYSDMGRILCSITGDTVGWHDPIAGLSNAAIVEAKYGRLSYQQARNDCHKNARDGILVEMGKWGLGPRDFADNVNFFSKVVVEDSGSMRYVPAQSKANGYVELRAEMNVLAIFNTCPHPLDPNPRYEPKAVRVEARRVPPPASDDPCRLSRPENGRGFAITERYFL